MKPEEMLTKFQISMGLLKTLVATVGFLFWQLKTKI